jgi:hypothetical protein
MLIYDRKEVKTYEEKEFIEGDLSAGYVDVYCSARKRIHRNQS